MGVFSSIAGNHDFYGFHVLSHGSSKQAIAIDKTAHETGLKVGVHSEQIGANENLSIAAQPRTDTDGGYRNLRGQLRCKFTGHPFQDDHKNTGIN